MPRRRKHSRKQAQSRPPRGNFLDHEFYNPFKGLDQHLARYAGQRTKETRIEKTATRPVDDDERLFNKAMADVTPLDRSLHDRVPPPPPSKSVPRFYEQEEIEAYTYLLDLVTGEGTFEMTYTEEYVDGAVLGLSPKILKKLRSGDFSYQDYVDLHGYNLEQAYKVVVRFIRDSYVRGYRCVLIIPGRGLNSEDRQPVLKKNLVYWLTHAPLKRFVLAFASARPYDGGVGALYVLVRKNSGKVRFVSPAGF